MKYQPPFDPDFSGPVDGIYNADAAAAYVNGNPATGQEGSIPPGEAWEHPLRELVHLITFSGQTPDHADLEQVRKAIVWFFSSYLLGNAGGVPVLEGLTAEGKQKIRPLIAGTNVTLDLVENPVDSGRYGIRISATGSGGAGAVALENVGSGAQVYKGSDGTYEELRSLLGANGITVSVAGGGNEILIDGGGLTSLAVVAPQMLLLEQRAGGAAAAVFPFATWIKRLNTIVANQIAGASFADGVITLPAGTYRVDGEAMARQAGSHRVRLRNTTTGETIMTGLTGDSNTGSGNNATCSASRLKHRFTLAGPCTLEFQHRNDGAAGVDSKLGDDSNVAPDLHTDAMLEIIKEA